MAKIKDTYICRHCGAESPQWKGQCPKCQEWNTLEITTVKKTNTAGKKLIKSNKVIALQDVCLDNHENFTSGLKALDKVLGNGFVPGSAILVGGEPAIGKSTLLLQLAGAVASGTYQEQYSHTPKNSNHTIVSPETPAQQKSHTVLYASGEESLPQIKARAERLDVLHENLLALATNRVQDIVDIVENSAPNLLIVDSIQTLSSDFAEGIAGNVSQVKACANELVEACKKNNTTLILVGHVTKDGDLAGPRLLEHLVDTVISLEGDRKQVFRLLRVLKNRFGPNQELLVFQMKQKGLEVVEDPSTFFLGARDSSLSGTAITMTIDGQRPFAVEIQALVTRTYLSIPRRTGLGFDVNRLHLLLAVLEKRLRINFGQVDIYAKVGGGMRLQEAGLDLALVAAVLSSFYDIPLPERAVFWGEVDLNGQIRPVSGHGIRLNQASKLGYHPIYCPPVYSEPEENSPHCIKTIAELQQKLFRK